jgi:hypothetical protein
METGSKLLYNVIPVTPAKDGLAGRLLRTSCGNTSSDVWKALGLMEEKENEI